MPLNGLIPHGFLTLGRLVSLQPVHFLFLNVIVVLRILRIHRRHHRFLHCFVKCTCCGSSCIGRWFGTFLYCMAVVYLLVLIHLLNLLFVTHFFNCWNTVLVIQVVGWEVKSTHIYSHIFLLSLGQCRIPNQRVTFAVVSTIYYLLL